MTCDMLRTHPKVTLKSLESSPPPSMQQMWPVTSYAAKFVSGDVNESRMDHVDVIIPRGEDDDGSSS